MASILENRDQRKTRSAAARLKPRSEGDKELRIHVDYVGAVDLYGMGRFFEEIALVVATTGGSADYIPPKVVSIQTGSIELVLSVSALAVGMGQLALQIRNAFATDKFSALTAMALADSAPKIQIIGAGTTYVATPGEIEAAATLSYEKIPQPHGGYAYQGEWIGTVYIRNDQPLIIFEVGPSYLARVRDERKDFLFEPLKSGSRYVLKGILNTDESGAAILTLQEARRRAGRQDMPFVKWNPGP